MMKKYGAAMNGLPEHAEHRRDEHEDGVGRQERGEVDLPAAARALRRAQPPPLQGEECEVLREPQREPDEPHASEYRHRDAVRVPVGPPCCGELDPRRFRREIRPKPIPNSMDVRSAVLCSSTQFQYSRRQSTATTDLRELTLS